MSAGRMREKLAFQNRELANDGYGNPQAGTFVTQFVAAAEVIPLKGSEPVLASRLTGVQPVIIRLRSCGDARRITTDWRALDARNSGRVYNITAIANMDQKNAVLDIMATAGVAT